MLGIFGFGFTFIFVAPVLFIHDAKHEEEHKECNFPGYLHQLFTYPEFKITKELFLAEMSERFVSGL